MQNTCRTQTSVRTDDTSERMPNKMDSAAEPPASEGSSQPTNGSPQGAQQPHAGFRASVFPVAEVQP